MGKRNTQAAIFDLLSCLGVSLNYKGHNQTAYAVELCREEPERLQSVTKLLYPELARRYQTSWKAVERNIRTVDGVIWRENRALLEEPARKPLIGKPRNAQLLAILAGSLETPLPANESAGAVIVSGTMEEATRDSDHSRRRG